jgi:hypothetical protein
MLKRLALGLLAAWAAAGFLREMNLAVAGWDSRQETPVGWGWRFGSPDTDGLARTLAAARETVPAGSVVGFAAPDDPPGVRFRSWRWAAYFLAEDDVLQVTDPAAAQLAQYAIAWRTELHDPIVEPHRPKPESWV